MPAVDVNAAWRSICTALGTEYRPTNEIHGQSGLVHPISGLGVDDKGKRLIVISADHSPRNAALMRMDVQASIPDLRVLVARPLSIDLPHIVRQNFCGADGHLQVGKVIGFVNALTLAQSHKDRISERLDSLVKSAQLANLSLKTQLQGIIEQFSIARFSELPTEECNSLLDTGLTMLRNFSKADNLRSDRESGICPIPTYEFTETDWELLLSGTLIDDVKERLRLMDVYQYFYPSKDALVLGLVDSGLQSVDAINGGINQAQADGHIMTSNTILDSAADVHDIVNELRRSGLIAEGEMEWEVTEDGKKIRNSVKFRPSEGLISRIAKVFSLRIDISSVLGK
ncbi:MAG: hypothetical protein Q4G36_09885 [Paracoccus sp. (in: a-proteobacteria)]|nr:hypothetical protein [Paracoccus sp. (in: a-proteobacteria)]